MSKNSIKKTIYSMTLIIFSLCLTSCVRYSKESFSRDNRINVISREEGSGTRDAFVNILKITDDEGYDATILSAEQNASTAVVLMTVQNDPAAIGYISFSAINDNVLPVLIDGVAPTIENIQNNTYKLARPFNLTFKEDLSPVSADFINYILSKQGQTVVLNAGYVPVVSNTSYIPSGMQGTVTISGSTSVAPLIKILAENYEKINPDVNILVSEGGSSTGITSVEKNICDIGMASRDPKPSELNNVLIFKTMALDGIAVIIHPSNPLEATLTSSEIRDIYTGKITHWSLEVIED